MILPSILSEVGLTAKALEEATEQAAKAEIIRVTKAAQQYWRSLAPVMQKGKAHPLSKGSSHIIDFGTYRDSLKIKFPKGKDGKTEGLIYSDEPQLSRWLEYGSVHNTVGGYAQKTADRFSGEVSS